MFTRRTCPVVVLVGVVLLSLTVLPVVTAATVQEILAKGKQLENAQQFEEALTVYQNGIREHGHENLYLEAGSLLGKLQRYREAEELLREALSKNNSLSLKNLLGLIKYRNGDSAGAKTVWQEVLTNDANNQFAHTWLKRIQEAPTAQNAPAPGSDSAGQASAGRTTAATTASAAGESSSSAAPRARLPLEEQQKLAKKLFQDMIDTDRWEFPTLISLHRQVIDNCPDTDQAEESCWRLSNLYLHGLDTPNFPKCIEVLEHLIGTYPNSPLYEPARERLIMTCKTAGEHDKVVSLYEELFRANPQIDDDRQFVLWTSDYAESLEAVGRDAEARKCYEQILQRDQGDSLEVRFAKERLGIPWDD